MKRILGIGSIVTGAILLFYGVSESNSITSQVQELFTGAPTDQSVLFMACGGGLAAVGVSLLLFGDKTT